MQVAHGNKLLLLLHCYYMYHYSSDVVIALQLAMQRVVKGNNTTTNKGGTLRVYIFITSFSTGKPICVLATLYNVIAWKIVPSNSVG